MDRTLVAGALGCVAALTMATTAQAATKHGITPLTPKQGATLAAGQPAEFHVRVKGPGKVFFHVCDRPRKVKYGVICDNADLGPGQRVGRSGKARRIAFRPDLELFPEYFLQRPGTYYWQAFRVHCPKLTLDCRQEGPVMRFTVA